MNRREFIRRAVLLSLSLPLLGGCSLLSATTQAEEKYHRIVVLSDCHLPVREQYYPTAAQQQTILHAKQSVRDDINNWSDVDMVGVTGDIAARWGIPTEIAAAQEYFSAFKAPLKIVAGNHDYIYTGELNEKGRNVWADKDGRRWKLAGFCQAWQLERPSYSLKLGQYRLFFLSPESLTSKYMVTLSQEQLTWLAAELAKYRNEPTIIFFHAPLMGTLEKYQHSINTPQMTAQPELEIKGLLQRNPQVFLWVSGHTHTSPSKTKSFADPKVNLYAGHVMNIHCDTMDRSHNVSNSLYLYHDRVEVKTFDHHAKEWLPALARIIQLPKL